jgi:hypothetical protein
MKLFVFGAIIGGEQSVPFFTGKGIGKKGKQKGKQKNSALKSVAQL